MDWGRVRLVSFQRAVCQEVIVLFRATADCRMRAGKKLKTGVRVAKQ